MRQKPLSVEDILKSSEKHQEIRLRLRHILFVGGVLLTLAWWIVRSASTTVGQ
jgi:hypothetical protein